MRNINVNCNIAKQSVKSKQMKNKKYHNVWPVPKSNRKIDTPNKQIYDRSLFWVGADTSMKSGRIK